jgi:predicted O-methyltransferase YrrM
MDVRDKVRFHVTDITKSRSVKFAFSRTLEIINRRIPLPRITRFSLQRSQYFYRRVGSHSFLNEYILQNSCTKILEIGVLNGDNARTMIEVAAKNVPPDAVEYYGFDVFTRVSYRRVKQKLEKTGCKVQLFKGDTLTTLPKAVKTLPKMDVIFIDGGKSYREAQSDWDCSKTLMHDKTAVFVHNADFPGVKRMVSAIPKEKYLVKLLQSPNDSDTAFILAS